MHGVGSLHSPASRQARRAATHGGVYGAPLKRVSACLWLLLISGLSVLHGGNGAEGGRDIAGKKGGAGRAGSWNTGVHAAANPSGVSLTADADGIQEEASFTEHGAPRRACMTKVEVLWNRIKEWWTRNRRPSSKKCEDVKRAGGIPSVMEGHSPIVTHGYPVYDQASGRVFLQPGVPLSVVNGQKQPIKVGVSDYIIRGTMGEIATFLECFEDFEVISYTLDSDGHWRSTPQESKVILQLQNVAPGVYSPVDVEDTILEESKKRLIALLSEMRSRVGTAVATGINRVIEFLELVKVRRELQNIPELFRTVLECEGAEEVMETIWSYIKDAAGWDKLEKNKGWTDVKTVSLTKVLTLKISSYPLPSHGVRATLVMPVNRTTLKEILWTLPPVFSITSILQREEQ